MEETPIIKSIILSVNNKLKTLDFKRLSDTETNQLKIEYKQNEYLNGLCCSHIEKDALFQENIANIVYQKIKSDLQAIHDILTTFCLIKSEEFYYHITSNICDNNNNQSYCINSENDIDSLNIIKYCDLKSVVFTINAGRIKCM